MKHTLSICFLLIINTCSAQVFKGINFIKTDDWSQVLELAKAERKSIFVDCYTTWCGPCKLMDKQVFSVEKVGEFMNKNFISIKIQMDSTDIDSKEIKAWYEQSDSLKREYSIILFPTYLYFNPDGELVHRGVGAIQDSLFIRLSKNALIEDNQYYTLLKRYYAGDRRFDKMEYLILKARELGERNVSNEIAKVYKKDYLDKLRDDQVFNKSVLSFIGKFPSLINSKDVFFRLFYTEGNKVDEFLGQKGVSMFHVKGTITREEIEPNIWQDAGKKILTLSPNWTKIRNEIKRKYNEQLANNLILTTQQFYYRKLEKWNEYATTFEKVISEESFKNGVGLNSPSWILNGEAWDVFSYCDKKSILEKALTWSNHSISLENDSSIIVQYYDTKANLLYKLGYKDQALHWEQKAIDTDSRIAQKEGKKYGDLSILEYIPNLSKMREGKSTWIMPRSTEVKN